MSGEPLGSTRMHMRRFTRFADGFGKEAEAHADTVAFYTVWYNFVRIHKTLRVAPAMAAGISDRLWSMEDAAAPTDAAAESPKNRGPYKPRSSHRQGDANARVLRLR